MSTYVESFHGLALKGGNPTVANCSSCHGVHDILPSSDPMSSVNPKDLPQTCGQLPSGHRHPAGGRVLQDPRAEGPREDKPWVVNLVSVAYIALIVADHRRDVAVRACSTTGARARAHVRAVKADPHAEERLTPSMRWQHLVLTVLFVALAYTGFVHTFPDAFFSWPFKVMPDGNALRSSLHRICGWAFVVFFAAHAAALLLGRTGRAHARAPVVRLGRREDAHRPAALQPRTPPGRAAAPPLELRREGRVLGARVGIRGDDHHRRHADLHRGDAAPLAEGLDDVAQVIHYYEAVLATLAILVWHAYWVVFDPAEYPMNPSWLIGTRASQHAHAPEPAQTAAQAPPPADEVTRDANA